MTALDLRRSERETADVAALADRVKTGDVRAVSRLITLLENRDPDGAAALRLLDSGSRHADVTGITGYPGAGKSTLIAQLAAAYRRSGRTVGVLAVDISSIVTKGALLGDRIRMGEHTLDHGVYIRSMAARGHHGGLAPATREAALVLDAAGYDVVLIETVGVGQGEIEVMDVAHAVVAVVAPGLGDEVQAMKAGLLEVAPIIVLNKGDHAGADSTLRDLRAWCPHVIRTVATTGEGIPELVAAIAAHRWNHDTHDEGTSGTRLKPRLV